ncbi:unnamed protein product [Cylindrotheca closterium]|uniref:DNRLRE domain-containing protein n=1 Tax=Cylindrotheca closterium TaxID=2856 RepID=A0AAD2CL69_9STRA|nr:unnamed protein product [Cylindrotheca closterium]
MADRLGLLWLCVGVASAQTPPVGHIAGNPNLSAGNLCDLSDPSTLVGELSVSHVATLFEGFGSSAASKDYFIAGLTSTGVRRSLLKFDLAGVSFPADVQVLCAEVRLSLDVNLSSSDAAPPEITLHEVTQDWSGNADSQFEGLNGSPAVNGDVTWEFTTYPTTRWANMGGDFAGDPLSRQQKTTAADGAEHEWFGNTKRMHALVNQWIGDSSSNHGLLVKSDEQLDDPIAYNVYHGAEVTTGLAPRLIVIYTAPSLGYPHKVAQGPGSPTGSPTIFDDMLVGIPTDSPTAGLGGAGGSTNGDSPTIGPDNGGSISSDSDSDSEDNAFGFTRESKSNTEYTAVALSVTGIALAAVVASLFGMIPHRAETTEELGEQGGNVIAPQSGAPTELV